IVLYVKTGSPTITCRELNLPIETFNTWKKKDWFKDAIATQRNEQIELLDSKLTESIDEAILQMQDRLKNGDTVYNQRTGKFTQAPAKLRDLNHAFSSLVEKRQLIRKLPTKITEQTTTAAQLQNLAEQFQQFVTGKIKEDGVEQLVDKVIEGDTVVQNEDGTWEVCDGSV
ncbi:MAG: hypothetical protein JHC33_13910, partial [Ignisphaera sp.]|nr:hypothetical protein [Ignisphaera sp.]